MLSEGWAIFLEWVSFFFVTLDLFGKNRLESLKMKLNSRATGIKELGIAKMYSSVLAKIFMRLGLLPESGIKLNFLILWIGLITIFLIQLKVPYAEYIVYLSLLLAYAILAPFVLLFILFLLEWLLDKLITLILFMFERFRLEGILIFVGAIIFTVSKVISFSLLYIKT